MRKIAVLVLFMFCMSSSSFAAQLKRDIGFQLAFPDDWSEERLRDGLMLSSTDERAVVMIFRTGHTDLDSIESGFKNIVSSVCRKAYVIGSPYRTNINGFNVVVAQGTGVLASTPSSWIGAVYLHDGKTTMVIGLTDEKSFKDYASILERIIRSISKR